MNGKEFKEFLEVICVSTNAPKVRIADYLNVQYESIRQWQLKGLPRTKSSMVISRLKDYLFENIGG